MIPVKPSGSDDLVIINPDLTCVIVRDKPAHERIGKRPGFAGKIPEIFNGDTNLLFYLTVDSLFECFTRFDKTREDAVQYRTENGESRQAEFYRLFLYA